jgi:hypothetical protein
VRHDPGRLGAAFDGTSLSGLPIGYGPAGTILIADIDPERLHEAWRAADARTPVTGWRPVLVTDDFAEISVRPEPDPAPPEAELRAFAEAATRSEAWLAYRHYRDDEIVDEGELEYGALTRDYQEKRAEVLAQWRDRWEVAVALPAGDAWFVHHRP